MTTVGQPEELPPHVEPGRNIQKGKASVFWGGVWVPVGDIEFLSDENNQIVKVISVTPRDFQNG